MTHGRSRYLAAAVIAGLVAGTAQGADLPRDQVDRIKKATVFVQVTRRSLIDGKEATSSGSGFVVDASGYIVTCWHVVRPVTEPTTRSKSPSVVEKIEVLFDSGRRSQNTMQAAVVAFDMEADLALLAVERGDLPPLKLSDDKPYETMQVWTFGFPLGRTFSIIQRGPEITASSGIVSALRHDDRDNLETIQTDAAVNPGNSGGPLVDHTGSVHGVVSSSMGATRLNFAIPVTRLRKLLSSVAPLRKWQRRGVCRVKSEPKGASVFVDGKYQGTTADDGCVVVLDCGLHNVMLCLDGYSTWISNTCLTDGTEINAELSRGPRVDLVLREKRERSVKEEPKPGLGLPTHKLPQEGAVLLSEKFDRPDSIDELEQSTGGTPKRTWYVADGEVHQHESDGVLHALFFGEEEWDNYVFSAKVRINDEHDDSRAGLIFRSSPNGFYLFRIHRETDKAQLAYHSTRPFGWFVLHEKRLDVDIAGDDNQMRVWVSGKRILCQLNGATVFNLADEHSSAGRAGLYSVQSKASFDDIKISSIAGEISGEDPREELTSYWFSDTFSENSTWWRAGGDNGDPVRTPWLILDGAMAQFRSDAASHVNVMRDYSHLEFVADVTATIADPDPEHGSSYGFVFGVRDEDEGVSDLRFIISSKDRSVKLVSRRGDKQTTITEGPLPADAFGATVGLTLVAKKSEVSLHMGGRVILRRLMMDGAPLPRGRFGLLSDRTRMAIHRLTLSSVAENR